MNKLFGECIRCRETAAVTKEGFCGHCYWANKAELEEGFYRIREYLKAWAKFDQFLKKKQNDD